MLKLSFFQQNIQKFSKFHSLKTKISVQNNDFRCRKLIDLIKNRLFWSMFYESYCFKIAINFIFVQKIHFLENFCLLKSRNFEILRKMTILLGAMQYLSVVFSRILNKNNNFDTKIRRFDI